jgi:hypothetical protein
MVKDLSNWQTGMMFFQIAICSIEITELNGASPRRPYQGSVAGYKKYLSNSFVKNRQMISIIVLLIKFRRKLRPYKV